MTATHQIAVSLALVLLAILVWRNAMHSRKPAIAAALAVSVSLFLTGTYFVADRLTGNGIDASVLFHLKVGLSDAGLADFQQEFATVGLIAVLIVAVSWFTYRLVYSESSAVIFSKRKIIGTAAVIASLIASPASNAIVKLSQTALQVDRNEFVLAPEIFHQVDDITFEPEKKNIVYLFLESVERTYLDENVFPGLMPRLADLQKEALNFTNIDQVSNTSWTISGMTAALCGMPLNGYIGNSMSGMERFLPRATCLSDLLSEQDYDLHFIGGASLDFAGKGNFLETHGFDQIDGRNELVPQLADDTYQSPWGLYDDSMYQFAMERFDNLADAKDPFALVLLTVDTHHPKGHLSEICKERVYGDGSNSMLNAVHCADMMLGEFVDHIRASPVANDTILVVASDHLAMPNKAWDQLSSIDRNNLLLFFGEDVPPRRDNRLGSTLDIGPTLLSLAGAETEKFGFGRSLLTDEPTLTESSPDIDEELDSHADFLATLWSYPSIEQGFSLDSAAERLVLGQQNIGYPALLLLDEELNVSSLRFEFYSDYTLNEQIEWLQFDQRFIWVDACEVTAPLAGFGGVDRTSYCTAFGTLGAPMVQHSFIGDGNTIPYSVIEDFFANMQSTGQAAKDRLERRKILSRVGQEDILSLEGPGTQTGNYLVRSAGFGTGNSLVANLETNTDVDIARGITVVGLNAEGAPMKLFHEDTCAWNDPITEMHNPFNSIDDTLQGFKAYFSSFTVVVDDSAVCDTPVDIQDIFTGTPFKKWDEIGFRRPYVGLIDGTGMVREYTGEAETALAVNLRNFLDAEKSLPTQRQTESLLRIAHAGGFADGVKYTNSFEALDQNRPYFELFEIDFVWTSDDQLVCLHDWSGNFQDAFGVDHDGPVDLAEFESLTRNARFQNCTLSSLVDWLVANPGARIIPDIKDRNVAALQRIATLYPEHMDRFIPQIYQPTEYNLVKSFGFDDIIWTLYRYHPPERESLIISWLELMDLYGLAMPVVTAEEGLAQRAQQATGVQSWVHTVNSQDLFDDLKKLGVTEIMTESLLPK